MYVSSKHEKCMILEFQDRSVAVLFSNSKLIIFRLNKKRYPDISKLIPYMVIPDCLASMLCVVTIVHSIAPCTIPYEGW